MADFLLAEPNSVDDKYTRMLADPALPPAQRTQLLAMQVAQHSNVRAALKRTRASKQARICLTRSNTRPPPPPPQEKRKARQLAEGAEPAAEGSPGSAEITEPSEPAVAEPSEPVVTFNGVGDEDVRVIKCRFQSKRAQIYIRLQLFPSTFN